MLDEKMCDLMHCVEEQLSVRPVQDPLDSRADYGWSRCHDYSGKASKMNEALIDDVIQGAYKCLSHHIVFVL